MNRNSKPLGVLLFVFLLALNVRAEKLPIKSYTTLDGLAHNHINRIKVDSHGFLWFCTDAGLSRFDGRQFFTLTTADGLPHPDVNDIVETRDGAYWLATDGGVSRFVLASPGTSEKPKIQTFRSSDHPGDRYDALEMDREGRLWAGGHAGLYRIEADAGTPQVRWMGEVVPGAAIPRILADRRAGLWIATSRGVVYRAANGNYLPVEPSRLGDNIYAEALTQDAQGRLWIGYRTAGLCRLLPAPEPGPSGIEFCIARQGSLVVRDIRSIVETNDGRLWVATTAGLCDFQRDDRRFNCYNRGHGLAENVILRLAEDPEGNLWLGSAQSGAMRLSRPGFVQFNPEDGWVAGWRPSLIETHDHRVVASSGGAMTASQFLELRSGRFHEFWNARNDPGGYPFHSGEQGALEDATGRWWLYAGCFLYQFPAGTILTQLRAAKPERFVQSRHVFHNQIYQDRNGSIWAATMAELHEARQEGGHVHVRAQTGPFHRIPAIEASLTRVEDSIGMGAWVSSFREDFAGGLWLGISNSRLVYPQNTVTLLRYHGDAVQEFSMADGLPPGTVNSIHLDRKGRLWLATNAGLARLDQPQADQRRFEKVQGLASDEVWCVTEDDQGRIYAGTAKGVDRLDLETGRVRHFTIEDGLPHGRVLTAIKSASGQLWFASDNAVSRFEPERLIPPPPRTYLMQPGKPLMLPYDRRFFEAEFSSPSFSGGRPRFQYKLSGVDQDWTPPVAESIVRYAGMSSGTYELQARAVSASGVASPQPVTLRFSVTPPFWWTWWFLTLAAATVSLVAFRLHQYRVERLLAVERLRVRIASDLHDDIGASLAQVSMLGELARRSLNGANPGVAGLIERMASASREAVSSMSDIVWSIHPRNDQLSDLVQRMRSFASDVLSARDIRFDLDALPGEEQGPLPLEVRRDLLLIFKEAVNNAARHSNCARVRAELRWRGGEVRLTVEDDGCGFDSANIAAGNGLGTMRARAARLGGRCEIHSAGGTAVTVYIPAKALA